MYACIRRTFSTISIKPQHENISPIYIGTWPVTSKINFLYVLHTKMQPEIKKYAMCTIAEVPPFCSIPNLSRTDCTLRTLIVLEDR